MTMIIFGTQKWKIILDYTYKESDLSIKIYIFTCHMKIMKFLIYKIICTC